MCLKLPDCPQRPTWIDYKPHKREWKRLQLSLRDKSVLGLLERLRKDNKDLADLLGHSERVSILRVPNSAASARKYESIRNHATNLYHALRHKFTRSCGCAIHRANLCLEHRNGAETPRVDPRHELHFDVLFAFELDQDTDLIEPPRDWRETRIKPLGPLQAQTRAFRDGSPSVRTAKSLASTATAESDAPTILAASGFSLAAIGGRGGVEILCDQKGAPANNATRTASYSSQPRPRNVTFALPEHTSLRNQISNNLSGLDEGSVAESKEINDLCKAMLNAKEASCLGVLVDEHLRRHRLSITNLSSEKDPMHTVSLQDLLENFPLDKLDRLVIGVKLASTLLQLHGTPWLTEMWGKGDILFKKQGEAPETALLGKPLLSKDFASCHHRIPVPSTGDSTSPREISLLCKNQGIFALGLLLIELWFGKPIDHLRSATDLGLLDQVNGITDHVTTRRLIDVVYKDAGYSYGDAVRRCIHCDFDQRSYDLDTVALKEAVHWGVVSPLEKNLDFFCDGRLSEVLV